MMSMMAVMSGLLRSARVVARFYMEAQTGRARGLRHAAGRDWA